MMLNTAQHRGQHHHRNNSQPLSIFLTITMLLSTTSFLLRPSMAFQTPARLAARNMNIIRHMTSSTKDDANNIDLRRFQNPNNNEDQIFSALSSDGTLKVTTCTVRNLLNDMMLQHTMNPVPADALGRTTICALLASSGMQEEQVFQIAVKGDGALRGCTVIVNGRGEAKGFVDHSTSEQHC